MSSTQFVQMYHPALGNRQATVPLQAADDYEATGWLLVDPDAEPPAPATPYITLAALLSQIGAGAAPVGTALRAALGAVPWIAAESVAAGVFRLDPTGKIIQRNSTGTTRSTYDSTEQALWTVVTGGPVTKAAVVATGLAASDVGAASAEVPPSLPAGSTLLHRYDPLRQTYNVNPDTLRKWYGALARIKTSGGAAARLTVVGHSYVVGTSTSPRHAGSFATKLRDLFNAKYGSAGTGLVHMVSTALTDESRIVVTGTWAQALGTRGAFNAACYNATGTGNTIAFTPDIPVDGFNVYYVRNAASGTFSMSVDGGAATTANANKSAPEDIAVAFISAGTLGTHTLTITPPASQQVYVAAVEGVVGTQGVRVTRVGRSGATVSTVTTSGTAGSDSLATIFTPSPDLTVVCCELNDYNTAVPVATFTTNLTTLINKAKLTGDVIVLADPNQLTQPNATSGLYQSAYHAAIYGLADSLNFGVVDIAARWKDYATAVAAPPGFMANAGIDAAGQHPYYIGHQDIANAIFAAVG